MILRDKPSLLDLLFAMQGSVLPRIAPRILGLAAFSALLVWADSAWLPLPRISAAPFAVFGVALSLFLGFRNNAAYERWWEGRRLWGQLIADARALGREAEMFLPQQADRHRVLRLALAFLHLHRISLRGLKDFSAPLNWAGEDFSAAAHAPCAALDRLSAAAAGAAPDGFARRALSERLGAMALAQAGCERIAATPLPYVYSLLVFRTAYLYCLLIPFALLGGAGWLTPLFVAIVAYALFGLAEVTEELARPFGETVNGLPLDAMCRTVEISLAPHLELAPPPRLAPRGYFLS
ncbi:bestrophin family protein [Roseobacteraceae bacterium NS-SX3]